MVHPTDQPDDRPNRRSESERDGAVFRALADPGRRALLDALYARDGQSLTDLSKVLPSMTRFGVGKHLAVLAEADLVLTEKVGRTKLHYLNPVPIRQIHDRWIARYAERAVQRLIELADEIEGAVGSDTPRRGNP